MEGRRRRDDPHLKIRKQEKIERLSKRPFETHIVPSKLEYVRNSKGRKKTPTVKDLPHLIDTIRPSNGPAEPLVEATRSIREMLSVTYNSSVEEVVNAGALPHLVVLLMRTDFFLLQWEAAWAFTSVASTNFTSSVVINLLRSPSPNVREQSAWCLGNIASDRTTYRDMLLEKGALEPLQVTELE